MGFKKAKDRFDRARAAVGIIGALAGAGGDPTVQGAPAGLAKQYGDYGKEVRLPATRRDIERTLAAATRAKHQREKTPGALTKKDIKKLK